MSVEAITAIFVSLTEPGQRRVEVAWEESDQYGGAREKVKRKIVSLLGKHVLNPQCMISDLAAMLASLTIVAYFIVWKDRWMDGWMDG